MANIVGILNLLVRLGILSTKIKMVRRVKKVISKLFKAGKRTQSWSMPAGLIALVATISNMVGFDLPTGWEDNLSNLLNALLFFLIYFLGNKVDRANGK